MIIIRPFRVHIYARNYVSPSELVRIASHNSHFSRCITDVTRNCRYFERLAELWRTLLSIVDVHRSCRHGHAFPACTRELFPNQFISRHVIEKAHGINEIKKIFARQNVQCIRGRFCDITKRHSQIAFMRFYEQNSQLRNRMRYAVSYSSSSHIHIPHLSLRMTRPILATQEIIFPY